MPGFDVDRYFAERRALIDRALERHLGEGPKHPEALHRAIHYTLFPGGKRLRPILTLATGELFGGPHRLLLPFACAVELVHTYSIVHDDLPALDNDDMRRGEWTAHKVFGEGIALLAGDALLTDAFYLMTRPQVARLLEPKRVLEIVHEIARAAGIAGLVGGQVVDLEAEGRDVDVATVELIHVRKTGALMYAAAKAGALAAGVKPKDLRRISRYAEFLGLAFQIADDIADAQGGAAGGGSTRDVEKKKATYPSVVGLPAAKERLQGLLQSCLKEIEVFGKDADPLRGIARYVVERVP